MLHGMGDIVDRFLHLRTGTRDGLADPGLLKGCEIIHIVSEVHRFLLRNIQILLQKSKRFTLARILCKSIHPLLSGTKHLQIFLPVGFRNRSCHFLTAIMVIETDFYDLIFRHREEIFDIFDIISV